MSALVYPALDPESWTGITIGGIRSPGFVEFPKFRVTRKIDEKPSPGSDSFSLTDKGAQCSDITIELRLWEPEHYSAYQSLYERYMDPRRPLNKRNVVTVVHPALHSKGIRQVYFFSADSPRTSEGVGVTVVKMVGKEYNAKTRIGGGSSKPKPAQFNAGALETNALNGRQPFKVVPNGGIRDTVPTALARDTTPVNQSRTVAEWRAAAAKGDPQAQHVVSVMDARAAAAKAR